MLTSAVAEVNSKEDDRKLRLRNTDSVFTTKLVTSGDKNAVRVSRDKREAELSDWVKTIFGLEKGFRPNFTVFVIEAKSVNQKTTGILTLALESDKYRMEKLIKQDRGNDRSKPSSQRYTGPEHDAFNVLPFKDISRDILVKYTQKLTQDTANLEESERKRLGPGKKFEWKKVRVKVNLNIFQKNHFDQIFFPFVLASPLMFNKLDL